MKKKVVIIGGGFAGLFLAESLGEKFEVILVDSKPFFEFTPGILRTIVEPKHKDKIQVMYKSILKNTGFILDSVKSIGKKVKLIDGDELSYDYLVVCSGSGYREPIKEQKVVLASRASTLIDAHEQLENARNVCIIGGGTVGVELAAEIATKYNGKKINLIHSRERLMDRDNPKGSEYALYFLKKNGVEVILNERVITGDKNSVETDKGRKIDSDIVFSCMGIKPNSDFMTGKMKNCLDEKGFIKVNEFLQVEGFQNMFSAGDVNNCLVEKTAQNAKNEAKIVMHNILALEEGKGLTKYDETKTPVVISLGKFNGILEYKSFVFTGILPAFMKWCVEKKEMLSL
ncbi:MAG: FAD-dependent oxidoreductase [Nanoarchaeota archaeon]